MKKIVVAGMLALGLTAVVQQEAHAWIHHRFSTGLGWEWCSGGNSILWGAWRNNQPGVSYDAHFVPHAPSPPPPPPVFVPPAHINVMPSAPVVVPAPAPDVPHHYSQHAYFYGNVPYAFTPSYANYAWQTMPARSYGSPFQVTTYPRQDYYYPNTWYGR